MGLEKVARMIGNNISYYPYASLTEAQLPLLKVATLSFNRVVILDPVSVSGFDDR